MFTRVEVASTGTHLLATGLLASTKACPLPSYKEMKTAVHELQRQKREKLQ